MQQVRNIILKGNANEVVINFNENLADYNNIVVTVGSETYSTALNPSEIYVNGTYLNIKIGEVTNLAIGKYPITVVADDKVLSSAKLNPLCKVEVR